jgi:hypothetical protein
MTITLDILRGLKMSHIQAKSLKKFTGRKNYIQRNIHQASSKQVPAIRVTGASR